MKRWIRIITCLLVVMGIAGCVEEKGSTVAETEPKEESKERIVSTTVAVTEILDALEVDHVVGIPTSYKQLPKRYDGKQVIGNPMKPDLEIVKSLTPTDVLSVTTLEYDLAPYFKEASIDATFLNLESLKNMQDAITTLGQKYKQEEQAKKLVAKFDTKIADIQKKVEGKERPSVLILLGVPGSYLVATENSYIGDLVKTLGGVNIVQGESVEYLASNTEYLQKSNPDIILRAAHGMPAEVVEMFKKEFKTNDIWKHFNAVKNDRVYDLEERIFPTTANLGAEEALDVLMTMLYPE